jgi:hypothetical protein
VTAPRTFSTFTKDAEFHLLNAERALQLASREAPSTGLQRFTAKQEGNLRQLRRVLPSVRDKARRS